MGFRSVVFKTSNRLESLKNQMKHFFIFTALVFATACFGQEGCPPPQDADGNGFIGATDLIDLLANVGDSDLEGDGIWDSEDECVGEYDECGICNGKAPKYQSFKTSKFFMTLFMLSRSMNGGFSRSV